MRAQQPLAPRLARGVRSFDRARRCAESAWEFDWAFGGADDAFAGHFPHQPILPGVFLVEMALRAAEYALGGGTGASHRVCSVERFRFLSPILPGDACCLRVEWPGEAAADPKIALRVSFSKAGLCVAQGVLIARVGSNDRLALAGGALPRLASEACAPAAATLRILRAMPHGNPMLLVDHVEDGAHAESAVAYKNITLNEPCFRDADGSSNAAGIAYPVSLLTESFGQGAGLLLARRGMLDRAGTTCAVVFGQFEHIEIVSDAFPGERLRHDVRLDQAVGALAVLSGQTTVGDRLIARFGSLKAFLVPTANLTKKAVA